MHERLPHLAHEHFFRIRGIAQVHDHERSLPEAGRVDREECVERAVDGSQFYGVHAGLGGVRTGVPRHELRVRRIRQVERHDRAVGPLGGDDEPAAVRRDLHVTERARVRYDQRIHEQRIAARDVPHLDGVAGRAGAAAPRARVRVAAPRRDFAGEPFGDDAMTDDRDVAAEGVVAAGIRRIRITRRGAERGRDQPDSCASHRSVPCPCAVGCSALRATAAAGAGTAAPYLPMR